MAGVKFLQTSFDSEPKTVGSYKAGTSDIIRGMLREQKRECAILHSNPIFREFKHQARQQSRGVRVQQQEGAPIVEDIEAEAKIRTLEFIRKVAVREDKKQKGVWASFGKPYVCLGRPQQLSTTLPKLNRDELNQSMVPMKPVKQSRQSSRGKSCKRPLPVTATHEHTKEEIEKDKLLKKQSVMHFSCLDSVEARFPEAPIKLAAKRRAKAMSSVLGSVDRIEASCAHDDPSEFGVISPREDSPIYRRVRAGSAPAKNARSSKESCSGIAPRPFTGDWIQQGSCASTKSSVAASCTRSSTGAPNNAHSDEKIDADDSSTNLAGTDLQIPEAPTFNSLTGFARPGIADKGNPVYKWHNDFVQVRHAARKCLQQALWERVQRRKKANNSPTLLQGASAALLAGIGDQSRLKAAPSEIHGKGNMPVDPWRLGARFMTGTSTAKAKEVVENLSSTNMQDVQLVECFYGQLCFLVEGLRQSDPLLLMVVQQAKVLLEGGQTLHRSLLRKIIEYLSDFVNKCNVSRHNKYLLHILTFIRQCVGVSALELTQMADIFGILPVVYTSDIIKEYRGQQSLVAVKSPNFRLSASRKSTLGRPPP